MTTASVQPFSLTPAQADNEVINYTTSEGKKLFISATTKLNIEFDGNPANLKIFLESLRHRARSSNWLQIMSIPDSQGIHRSIIDEYGQLTMKDVRANVDTYHGTNSRDAQNCYQLYTCLLDSITKEVFLKVNADADQYLLQSTKEPSGICFLLLLIQSATIHTRATINTIRKSLYSLDTYMIKVDYDIEKFNQFVKLQREALMSRGESASGLITNLFVAYECVEDSIFQAYMTTQQDAYVDGREDFTEDRLMEVALNKYKILIEADKWNVPSAQDTKIVALTAEINALKQQGATPANNPNQSKGRADNAWKRLAPQEDDPTTKVEGRTTYHWCVKHKSWTIHTSAECRGIKANSNQRAPKEVSPTNKGGTESRPSKLLQATNALVSLLGDEEDEE